MRKLENKNEQSFYGRKDELIFFGLTQQGSSHVRNGKKNQDRFAIKVMGKEKGIVAAAIADGVGSCLYSDIGAEIAVWQALSKIETDVNRMVEHSDDNIIKILKEAMQKACDKVKQYAKKHKKELKTFHSTLSIVIYDGKDAFIAHAGDDGVVVLDAAGQYGLVTTRHKGETVNSVIPLQEKSNWEFMIVRDTVGVIMATDGVLDSFVYNAKEEERVFFPFIKMITKSEIYDERKMLDTYKKYFMSGTIRNNIIIDDITFVVVFNRLKMLETKFPVFDEKKWFEMNRKREENIFRVLNHGEEPTEEIREAWVDKDRIILSEMESLLNEGGV